MRPRLCKLEVKKKMGRGGRENGKARMHEGASEKGKHNCHGRSAAERVLRELGRYEMRSSYLYSLCKGLARIAYYSRQSLSRSPIRDGDMRPRPNVARFSASQTPKIKRSSKTQNKPKLDDPKLKLESFWVCMLRLPTLRWET